MPFKTLLMVFLFAPVGNAKISDVREIKGWSTRACHHHIDELSCAHYVKNYDGDTITFDIPELHPLVGAEISVRVFGIDAPEIRTKDDCEKKLAYKAKEEVEKLMLKAQRIDLLKARRGKYFRILAEVYVDGRSLGDILVKKGLAVPYDGGTRPDVDWCRY